MREKIVITKLLQSVTKVYYKVCQVLQSVTKVYCKVCHVLQSVTGYYYKVRQLLQSATAITKEDITGGSGTSILLSSASREKSIPN